MKGTTNAVIGAGGGGEYEVTITAVNYSGADIAIGDKVYLVPQAVQGSNEWKEGSSALYSNVVTRDGQYVYTSNRRYKISDGSYTAVNRPSYSLSPYHYTSKEIYIKDPAVALTTSRGAYLSYFPLDDDMYVDGDGVHFEDGTVVALSPAIQIAYGWGVAYNNGFLAYAEYGSSSGILYFCKIDKENKTVEQVFNPSFSKIIKNFEFTSDGKYLIIDYQTNSSFMFEVDWDAQNVAEVTDYSSISTILSALYGTDCYVRYNCVDEILTIAQDYSPYTIYTFKYNNGRFDLIAQIYSSLKQTPYETTSDATGLIILNAWQYITLTNTASGYKAIANANIASGDTNLLVGIATSAAADTGTFTAVVAAGAEQSLTVSSNIETAIFTIE